MTTPQIAIGIDYGNGFTAVTIRKGTHTTHMAFPSAGSQLATVLFDDNGSWVYGQSAEAMAFKDPTKCYRFIKRGLADNPDDPWLGSPHTPVTLTTLFLRHVWKVIQTVHPEVCNYVPELGGTEDSELLSLVMSHPDDQTLQQQGGLRDAVQAVGDGFGGAVKGFLGESAAAAHLFREQHAAKLRPDQHIAVLDAGTGTFDVSVLLFDGKTISVVCHAGEVVGGLNCTGALYVAQCDKLGIASLYDPAVGLVLSSGLNPDEARLHNKLWETCDALKIELSNNDSPVKFLDHGSELLELSVTRDEADALWETIRQRMHDAMGRVLQTSSLTWSNIPHVLCVGGGALLSFMRPMAAAATDRDEKDVYIDPQPSHVVSNGNAYQAMAVSPPCFATASSTNW